MKKAKEPTKKGAAKKDNKPKKEEPKEESKKPVELKDTSKVEGSV